MTTHAFLHLCCSAWQKIKKAQTDLLWDPDAENLFLKNLLGLSLTNSCIVFHYECWEVLLGHAISQCSFPLLLVIKLSSILPCRWGGQGSVKAGAAVLGSCWRCVCMRCSGIGPDEKAGEKEKVGKPGELGFAELKRANFSEEQVSTTSGIKRWISPSDKSRLRWDHLQKHGGLWADGVCCWHTPLRAAGQRCLL